MIKVTIKTEGSGANESRKREAGIYKFDVERKSEGFGKSYQLTQTLQITGAGQHDFRNGTTVYDEGDKYNKEFKYIDELDIELDAKDVKEIIIKALETKLIQLSDLIPLEILEAIKSAQSKLLEAEQELYIAINNLELD